MTLREAAQATADNLECVCEVTRHPPCHVCALRTALASPDPGGWREGARARAQRIESAASTLQEALSPWGTFTANVDAARRELRSALALPVPPAMTPAPEAPREPCGYRSKWGACTDEKDHAGAHNAKGPRESLTYGVQPHHRSAGRSPASEAAIGELLDAAQKMVRAPEATTAESAREVARRSFLRDCAAVPALECDVYAECAVCHVYQKHNPPAPVEPEETQHQK